MNLSQATQARSDQLNSDDLIAGPRTFTVGPVRSGNAEQPVVIELLENPGRPFKPSKTALRVLAYISTATRRSSGRARRSVASESVTPPTSTSR